MAKYMPDCLTALLNQSFTDFELIIVDDLSSDNTQSIIKRFKDSRVKLYENSELLGLSRSRNESIKYAKGKYVFFTDADCRVSMDWLKEGVKSFETIKAVGVEGKTFYVSENYRTTRSDSVMDNLSGGKFLTCNMAFDKKILEKVGMFDERFTYHEDRDLALRILKVGRIVFNEKMIVYHQKKNLTPKQFVQSGKRPSNRVLLYKKFGDKPTPLFLGRIFSPSDLLKLLFPPIIFGSLLVNKYRATDDYKIFPYIYVKILYERLIFWQTCTRERVFLI
jgi:GT2 family glycosyltransferase